MRQNNNRFTLEFPNKTPRCHLLLPYDLISSCYIISESSSFCCQEHRCWCCRSYWACGVTPSKLTITANLKAIIFDESRMILRVTIIVDEISTGCTTFPPPIDPIIIGNYNLLIIWPFQCKTRNKYLINIFLRPLSY